eukprot:2434712-Rhodomonas_salina.1
MRRRLSEGKQRRRASMQREEEKKGGEMKMRMYQVVLKPYKAFNVKVQWRKSWYQGHTKYLVLQLSTPKYKIIFNSIYPSDSLLVSELNPVPEQYSVDRHKIFQFVATTDSGTPKLPQNASLFRLHHSFLVQIARISYSHTVGIRRVQTPAQPPPGIYLAAGSSGGGKPCLDFRMSAICRGKRPIIWVLYKMTIG